MSEYNDDKIKKALESQEVPAQLSPESIKLMLDQKAPDKKREKISRKTTRLVAGAAACAVICGSGVYIAEQGNLFNTKKDSEGILTEEYGENVTDKNAPETSKKVSVMPCAQSYEKLYDMLGDANENYEDSRDDDFFFYAGNDMVMEESAVENAAGGIADGEMTTNAPSAINPGNDTTTTGRTEHSDTYNQEEGVLEADIVKTDGEFIYYLASGNYGKDFKMANSLYSVKASDGVFAEPAVIDLEQVFENATAYTRDPQTLSVLDMYLYNDLIAVIGSNTDYSYYPCDEGENSAMLYGDAYCEAYSETFVAFFSQGEKPQLVDFYSQEGYYSDVRIAPDGFMYLVTETTSQDYDNIEDEENVSALVPSYTNDGDTCCIEPACIFVPEEGIPESNRIFYTVISSINLNTPAVAELSEVTSIASASGNIYCSANNLYLASGYDKTEITRVALDSGSITPVATGSVNGYIKDQFSMSEHNGYFRIATTVDTWRDSLWDQITGETGREINNHLYVLDMELNQVGHITDFGIDETIKSVSYSGDMAYVVTYEQTDPLFSIDLTNPAQPVILDELKILGYSSYMQNWSDGLLLGFGPDADEYGIENGVKLVMFDNSDPNNLNEVGIYAINHNDEQWLYSMAVWERKALLIAPEKNLIGFPVDMEYYENDKWYDESKYLFFSYDNGEFTLRGELSSGKSTEYGKGNLNRAVYIGDYVYALSADKFISADIETMTVKDTLEF